MKLALGFTLNGWPTALEFCAFTHSIAPCTNDLAPSGGQHDLNINNVNVS